MVIKHIILFISVYITVNLYISNKIHPIIKMRNTLLSYVLFMMFTKMNIVCTCLVFFLILSIFIINNYIDYYKEHKKEYKHLIKINETITKIILSTMVLVFIIYFLINEKSILKIGAYKYLFGVVNCKGIRN
mgnify:CR=1 FL=1